MRVIITGGTGLIGRALASSLARDGHEVIVLSRDPSRHTDLPAGVRAVRWDARSAADWGELADGAGAIVNLAGDNIGAGRWTAERKRRIRQSRIDPGRAVSAAGAGDWADRLLPLPPELLGVVTHDLAGIGEGLVTTGYFLTHGLAHALGDKPLPEARARLVDRLSRR